MEAEPLGNNLYRSRVPGQEGCVLLIPERTALATLFPERRIEIGEFGLRFQATTTRFWIITYRMPDGHV